MQCASLWACSSSPGNIPGFQTPLKLSGGPILVYNDRIPCLHREQSEHENSHTAWNQRYERAKTHHIKQDITPSLKATHEHNGKTDNRKQKRGSRRIAYMEPIIFLAILGVLREELKHLQSHWL
mmetsp:Transcript_45136/g.142105  ORF Transcript_45136/g.142105 Transcript_45136/m.142105 type:complete len:124 (-) Transcript_45136:35-406(-)